MSTVNNVSNSSIWGVQTNNNQVTGTQGKTKVHHHKDNDQDSIQISDQAKDATTNKPKSPLDSLVASGTITQDQESAVRSAFMAARQANSTGTYGTNTTNPINSLVANGTITQTQADSITNAFKSSVNSVDSNNQSVGSTKQGEVHHHHHPKAQSQDSTQSNSSVEQTLESIEANSNSDLDDLLTQGNTTNDQENSIETAL